MCDTVYFFPQSIMAPGTILLLKILFPLPAPYLRRKNDAFPLLQYLHLYLLLKQPFLHYFTHYAYILPCQFQLALNLSCSPFSFTFPPFFSSPF